MRKSILLNNLKQIHSMLTTNSIMPVNPLDALNQLRGTLNETVKIVEFLINNLQDPEIED